MRGCLGAASSLREEDDEPFVGEMTVVAEAERRGRADATTAEEYDAERAAGTSLSAAAAAAAASEALRR